MEGERGEVAMLFIMIYYVGSSLWLTSKPLLVVGTLRVQTVVFWKQ